MKKYTRFLLAALACASLATPQLAAAQDASNYPNKPIRLIVPFPPGGGTDILARLVSKELSESAGWNVIVDNKAGAGGTIGVTEAARAPANGYEMLMGQKDNLVVGAWIYKNLPWNPETDFTPVAHVAFTPIVIATSVDSRFKTLQDVIDAAKKEPGSVTYAHPGTGTSVHLAGNEFAKASGIDLLHVPYKGSNPAIVDAVAGNVDILLSSLPSAISQINAKKLRPLAVTSAKRSVLLPDVPTVQEAANLAAFDIITWYGLLMPKGSPEDAVERIHQQVNSLLNQDSFKQAILKQGAEPLALSREEFAALIHKEYQEWKEIVQSSGVESP